MLWSAESLDEVHSVGAIVGAVLTGMLAQRLGLVRVFTDSLLIVDTSVLVYSRLTSFIPALVVIICAGVFLAALNVAIGPLLLRVTPRAYVGRVIATLNPTSAMMQVVGIALAGYLASNILLHLHVQLLGMTFGPIDTIFTGGAVLILIGGIYALIRLGFTDPQPITEADPASIVDEPVALTVSEDGAHPGEAGK